MFLKWCLHFVFELWPLSVPCQAVGCVCLRTGAVAWLREFPAAWVWAWEQAPRLHCGWTGPWWPFEWHRCWHQLVLYLTQGAGFQNAFQRWWFVFKLAFQHIWFGPENPTCLVSPPLRCGQQCAHPVRARLWAKPFLCWDSVFYSWQRSSVCSPDCRLAVRGHAVNAACGRRLSAPQRSSPCAPAPGAPEASARASPATPARPV